MNVTEYMVQQANEFNHRVDETQKMIQLLVDRLARVEYNIERLEQSINVVADTLPLVLSGDEGERVKYEKYLKKS